MTNSSAATSPSPSDLDESATRTVKVVVPPDSLKKTRLFVAASAKGETQDFTFTVHALDAEGGSASDDVTFERPGN